MKETSYTQFKDDVSTLIAVVMYLAWQVAKVALFVGSLFVVFLMANHAVQSLEDYRKSNDENLRKCEVLVEHSKMYPNDVPVVLARSAKQAKDVIETCTPKLDVKFIDNNGNVLWLYQGATYEHDFTYLS